VSDKHRSRHPGSSGGISEFQKGLVVDFGPAPDPAAWERYQAELGWADHAGSSAQATPELPGGSAVAEAEQPGVEGSDE
jgi:hypothetical protein